MIPGASAQFAATVTGSENTSVTWSATGGTISPAGVYSAGSTPGTYRATATSVADPTQSDTVVILILEPVAVRLLSRECGQSFSAVARAGEDLKTDDDFAGVAGFESLSASQSTNLTAAFDALRASASINGSGSSTVQGDAATESVTTVGSSGNLRLDLARVRDGFLPADANGDAHFACQFRVSGSDVIGGVTAILSGSVSYTRGGEVTESDPPNPGGSAVVAVYDRTSGFEYYVAEVGDRTTGSQGVSAQIPLRSGMVFAVSAGVVARCCEALTASTNATAAASLTVTFVRTPPW